MALARTSAPVALPAQRDRSGARRRLAWPTPWLFLAPNMLIFGAFTFLPIIINFYYAFTGGVRLFPSERPFTGMENLETLFDCTDYFSGGHDQRSPELFG